MPSTQASITRFLIRALLRPYLMSGPIAQQRRRFASLARPQRLRGATIEPVMLGGVKAEWVVAPNADPERVVYFIHGGGFVACSPATHRGIAARIGRAAGARVLLVDYRLAPEHPFPAALDDSVAGYRWLLENGIRPEHIAITGDSAGGLLALTTLLSLRDAGDPLPAAGVCLSPATDATLSGASMRTRARDEAMLTPAFVQRAVGAYVGSTDPRSPLVSPLYADLRGLPPLLVHVGTHELLLDDSVRFAAEAQRAGVEVTLRVFEGMWHVFHGFDTPESSAAVRELGAFVRDHTRDRQQRHSPIARPGVDCPA